MVEGWLQGRRLEHGLQGLQQQDAQGQHQDGHQGGHRNGEGGDDLILLGAGLYPGQVPGVDGAGNLHVDQVAGDEGQVTAAGTQHRRVNQELYHGGGGPDQAYGQEAPAGGGQVRHSPQNGTDQERRAHQHDQGDQGDDAAQEMGSALIGFDGFFSVHDLSLLR